MLRIELPEGNGWTRRLMYLLLIGYVLLVFAILVFVVITSIHEIRHW